MKLPAFSLVEPDRPQWSIAAAKTDYSVQPVENSRNLVENLWILCGEETNSLWKQCGFRGEKLKQ